MNWLVILACVVAGLGCLLASMPRHVQRVFGAGLPRSRRRTYRVSGIALLVLCLAYTLHAFGIGVGLVVFFAAATTGGLLCTLTLAYAPVLIARWLAPVTIIAAALLAWSAVAVSGG